MVSPARKRILFSGTRVHEYNSGNKNRKKYESEEYS